MSDEQPTNPRFVNLLGLTGQRLRDFELGEIIGQGGFGVVYEARRGGVLYALKAPLVDYADAKRREQALAELPRIKKESAALQSLQHPNIVALAEYFTWNPLKDTIGDVDGLPILVMRHVDGVAMDRWVRRSPAPTLRQILVAYRSILDALEYCHAHSFFHRDIKPSNILVEPNGQPVLIDFGIAKSKALKTSTEVASWIGTTDFFAPEYLQYPFSRDAMKGLPFTFTPAQDLYALGHTFFLTLTGATAWAAWKSVLSTQPSVAFMAIAQKVDLPRPSALNPRVPADVDAVVAKLMAREVSMRFPTAREAMLALDAILSRKDASGVLELPFVLPTAEECERRVEEFSELHAAALDEAAEDEEGGVDLPPVDVSLSGLVGTGSSQTHVRPSPSPTAASKGSTAATRPLPGRSERPPSGRTTPRTAPGTPPTPTPSGPPSAVAQGTASRKAERSSSSSAPRADRISSSSAPKVPGTAGFKLPSAVVAPAAFADPPPADADEEPIAAPEPTALSPELERLRDEFRDYERPAKQRSSTMLVGGGAAALLVLVLGIAFATRGASVAQPVDAVSLLDAPSVGDGGAPAADVYKPAPLPAPAMPLLAAVPTQPVGPPTPAPTESSKPRKTSADAKAIDDILKREYGGQRPTVGADGTTVVPSGAGTPGGSPPPVATPGGWGTRAAFAQSAAAPTGPRKFGVGIGAELPGTLLKPLDSRIGSMPVVVRLKRAWAPRGEVLLPTGTMFYGQASSTSGRFSVSLTRLKLPDGFESPLQALGYDGADKKPGLSPSRRIQSQGNSGPGVGDAVVRGAANVALGQVQGGPLADVARNAGQTVVNQPGAAGSQSQDAMLLDAPVDLTIFITEAF